MTTVATLQCLICNFPICPRPNRVEGEAKAQQPLSTNCGHVYHRKCIVNFITRRESDLVGREIVSVSPEFRTKCPTCDETIWLNKLLPLYPAVQLSIPLCRPIPRSFGSSRSPNEQQSLLAIALHHSRSGQGPDSIQTPPLSMSTTTSLTTPSGDQISQDQIKNFQDEIHGLTLTNSQLVRQVNAYRARVEEFRLGLVGILNQIDELQVGIDKYPCPDTTVNDVSSHPSSSPVPTTSSERTEDSGTTGCFTIADKSIDEAKPCTNYANICGPSSSMGTSSETFYTAAENRSHTVSRTGSNVTVNSVAYSDPIGSRVNNYQLFSSTPQLMTNIKKSKKSNKKFSFRTLADFIIPGTGQSKPGNEILDK